MNARIFYSQFVMGLKLYLRRPAAIFWMVAFPVLMLVGLSALFGSGASSGVALAYSRPANLQGSDRALQEAFTKLGVKLEILAPEQAAQRWKSGKLPVLLERPNGSYNLRVNSYLAGQGMQIVALVQQSFLMEQARVAGAGDLRGIPVVMESPGGHHDTSYAAFLLPGLLGLNLLMMGVFSVGMVDVELRVKGIYRRLAITPLPRHVYIAAQMAVRLVVVIITAAALLFIGAMLFGIQNQGSYGGLFLLIFLGTACFASMGYVLASFANSVETANGMANLVFLPLMMLSGVYFSLDAAPAWIQTVSDYTPLTLLLKGMRAVFNDGVSLASLGPSLLMIGLWTALLFTAAARRFKWV